jgi:hypothetical protein
VIKDGIVATNAKFREMGEQAYAEAEKVKESHRVL